MASRNVVQAAYETNTSAANGYSRAADGHVYPKNYKVANPGKATVLAIGRAVPRTIVHQEGLTERFLRQTNHEHDSTVIAKLERLCKNTTVKTRYVVLNDEILREHPEFLQTGVSSVRQRLEVAGEAVLKMAAEAADKAILEWGRPKSEITHMVYVSSSEVRLPGGDLLLSQIMGLRSDINRVMLYMLGCYGGATGIRVAKDLTENNPGSRVLLVTCETTLVGFRPPNPKRPYDLVGAALFGDGAGAMIIGADPIPIIERPWFELYWAGQSFIPTTDCVIHGVLTEEGISFNLGRELPSILEANIEDYCKSVLKKVGKDMHYDDLFWAVHPGGPAILNAVEKKLNLLPEKLVSCREVLADYGNISSNTIIYVLDYIRKASLKRKESNVINHLADCEWGYILAFGPGITIEGAFARNLV